MAIDDVGHSRGFAFIEYDDEVCFNLLVNTQRY